MFQTFVLTLALKILRTRNINSCTGPRTYHETKDFSSPKVSMCHRHCQRHELDAQASSRSQRFEEWQHLRYYRLGLQSWWPWLLPCAPWKKHKVQCCRARRSRKCFIPSARGKLNWICNARDCSRSRFRCYKSSIWEVIKAKTCLNQNWMFGLLD